MDTERSAYETFQFLDYELCATRRRLLQRGTPVAIGGRAFDLLLLLVRHAGEVLSKRAVMQAVWPHLVVEEVNVRAQVKTLRKLLGSDGDESCIVNVTGRGYCFTAPVRVVPARSVWDQQRVQSSESAAA